MHRLIKQQAIKIIILSAALLLAACGGATGDTAMDGATPVAGEDAVSQADPAALESLAGASIPVSGTDFCDAFPAPQAAAYTPPADSLLVVTDEDYVRGPADAAVTLILYNDFACESCRAIMQGAADLLAQYDDIRMVFRPLPLPEPVSSAVAAQAAEGAGALGGPDAFWAMIDLLYANQAEWKDLAEDDLYSVLSDYAAQAGVDGEALIAGVQAGDYEEPVVRKMIPILDAGAPGAPVVFMNAQALYPAPPDAERLNVFREIALTAITYGEAPPLVIDPAGQYRAWLETEKGTIVLDLFADIAPQTVNNFAFLACSGYYDDIVWHRVIPGFVAQTGDPSGTGLGGPGYSVPDENDSEAYLARGMSFDRAGLLSMARSNEPDSAGSQFFITYGPATRLDTKFTIFGEVLSGMDVLEQLTPYEADPLRPGEGGDRLLRVIVRRLD
ncbi:MAG: hypothetical protein Kow00124_30600 [Anaerolineae bacterium]